ncbi:MAG: dihydrolipoyl dehydrogenase, partial [bacterium]|nr:dihydrolipoyl dehydrogenase [bacterium]
MKSFDLIIIGAGPGGYVAAIRAAQLGLNVALVEKRRALGGTCLNIGCIPSKALLESSELFAAANESFSDHGIALDGIKLKLDQMLLRKDKIVQELTQGVEMLMKKNKVSVFTGRGVVTDANHVTITGDSGDESIEGKTILLAMGSEAVELPFLPFDGDRIVSSTEALSFDKVPKHLVVIGAGAIGLELGSVWKRLGAEVTVVELLQNVAPFADRQMSKALERALKDQGLAFKLGHKVTGAKVLKSSVKLSVEDPKGETEEISCDRVLVAVGRRPYTEATGIEALGIELEPTRQVKVDESFRTNVSSVYAIGDLIAGPMLAHKAEDEGMAVAEILAGKPGHVNYNTIPNVVYTEPELASVGKTEAELKEEGIKPATGRFQFRANGRA